MIKLKNLKKRLYTPQAARLTSLSWFLVFLIGIVGFIVADRAGSNSMAGDVLKVTVAGSIGFLLVFRAALR